MDIFGGGAIFGLSTIFGATGLGGDTVGAAGIDRRGCSAAIAGLGEVSFVGVRREANPFGKDNCDRGGSTGGGKSPPFDADASGGRPERSIPGKVGSGPSLSNTLRSTMTLGRLEPGGKTKYCCAPTGNAVADSTQAITPTRQERMPRYRPKFRTRISNLEAYSLVFYRA